VEVYNSENMRGVCSRSGAGAVERASHSSFRQGSSPCILVDRVQLPVPECSYGRQRVRTLIPLALQPPPLNVTRILETTCRHTLSGKVFICLIPTANIVGHVDPVLMA